MTVLRFDGAEDSSFDLSNLDNLRIAQVLTQEATNWRYLTPTGVTVQFLGTSLTYDENGVPVAGVIDTVRLVLQSGEVLAFDQALDAAAIGSQPELLWDTVLAGKDIINVRELGADIGDGSTIFGDGIKAAVSANSTALTGTGEKDVFILGAGSYRLIGDVMSVGGVKNAPAADGKVRDLFARYQGGDDLITGADTTKLQRITGDVNFVGANGTLIGGNDNLSIVTSQISSDLVGDAQEAFGLKGAVATVIGGDDEIDGLKLSVATLIGDLNIARDFVTLRGGDDIIGGSDAGEFISGDLGFAVGSRGVSITGGDDTIDGDGGDDQIMGDAFESEARELAKAGGKPGFTLKGGDDEILGGSGSDIIFGEMGRIDGDARAARADAAIRVIGGNDTIDGGDGSDRIFGQVGKDVLKGGSGLDELSGGAGRDTLNGGFGQDVLTGGTGADIFVIESVNDSFFPTGFDIITDFSRKQGDRIDLSSVDGDLTIDGRQPLEFIGKAAEGGIGELRFVHAEGDTFLIADFNGGDKADFRIRVEGEINFKEADFLF